MQDITGREDIVIMVEKFYELVKQDDIIGHIFLNKINDSEWPSHMEKMVNFWMSVLFSDKTYVGNPFSHHRALNIGKEHFDRWEEILHSSVYDHFKGQKADEAIDKANKMRLLFESKLAHIKSNPDRFNIL